MKTSREMRQRTWQILQRSWFVRLLAVGFVLQALAMLVNGLIVSAFAKCEIVTLSDFFEKKVMAMSAGLDYTLPTLQNFVWMIGGFLFQTFMAYIFAAILAFGFARTLLKAERNETDRWFADAFGGFARPFEVTGLLILMNVQIFLWMLLLIVPGLIAVYRYRLAWFIKNEHPEMSARACLAESGRRMKGYKYNAFILDISFLGWFLLAAVVLGAAAALPSVLPALAIARALSFVIGVFGFYLMIRTMFGIIVSRVVFYREIPSSAS